MIDVLSNVISILTSNWTSSNTDGNTPTFAKITDYKRIDFGANYDWILVHRSVPFNEPAGVGGNAKRQSYELKIDVRTWGDDKEGHWIKVLSEVERILDSKLINPDSTFDILEPDGIQQDLSDKTHAVYRMMVPVKLTILVKSRS